jgi:DNA-binding MarR family transcriptional regulator
LSTESDFERPRDFLVDAMRDVFFATAAELGRRLPEEGFYAPTATQIGLMSLLTPQGMRATELARRAQVTKQAVDQMVDQLERVGVLARVADPTDRRARLIRPTPYALRGYAASRRMLTEIHAEWRARLGDELYGQLERALALLTRITPDPSRAARGPRRGRKRKGASRRPPSARGR